MKKRTGWWIALVVVIIALGAGFGFYRHNNSVESISTNKKIKIGTPTFFFHGYGSSWRAEKQMANAAKSAGATSKIPYAEVTRAGRVKLKGRIKSRDKNPIVLVQYDNPRNANYKTNGRWAQNVVRKLQSYYRFKKINMVGHSMGNMAIMYYNMATAGKKTYPQLNKQVDIAGHFNGIKGMDAHSNSPVNKQGKPKVMTSSFKGLLPIRHKYPRSARVLNIYGNYGDGSDGDVYVNSAKTLKYLVSGRAKSYQERLITGKQAQHSRLHENKQVDRILIKFLWNK